MRRTPLLVALGLLAATAAQAQMQSRFLGTRRYVASCPYADSLLGRDHGDSVFAQYNPAIDRTRLSLPGFDFSADIMRLGRSPDEHPASQITLFVREHSGAADILADSTGHPSVTLYLNGRDDSLMLGKGTIDPVNGSTMGLLAPVTVGLTPVATVLLAKAHHAYIRIGPKRLQIIDENIHLFSRLLRFAVCDSVPAS